LSSDVKRQEVLVAGWAALTFGALLASYMAFRPVRDALILKDSDRLVWLFTATLVVVAILSATWTHVVGKLPPRRTVPKTFHVFAGCCIVFAILVGNDIAPVITRRAFYVWSAAFNLFVVSVFWGLLADLLGPATAKKLYGPIAAGGTIGAIAGPALTRVLVDDIGIDGVLVMSAVLLEVAVIGVTQVRHHGEKLGREPDEPTPGGALRGFENVARSPYLLGIVAYVLLTATAATFVYLEQAPIVRHELPNPVHATEFYASMELWTQVGTLVVQTLLATPLLAFVGPGVVMMLLPLAQGIGISALVASPTIQALAPVYIGTRVITHGLTRPARELLFTVVSRDDKYQAKHAIDTFGYRLGDFSSAWLYKGLTALGFGSVALMGAMLPLSVIWAGIAVALGIGYKRRLPK
jgi:AAA family ATP:ADP antiporter